MVILDTNIDGLKVLEPKIFEDNRGNFIKTFNYDFFKDYGLELNFKESFFTTSYKNVIRGMHFQKPPYDHIKMVYVPKGKVQDVVLDIRKTSKTYGKYFSIELSDNNCKALIIPKGLAHGFKSLEDGTIIVYMQTQGYAPHSDDGIKYDSFGFDWNIDNPIVSQRDLNLTKFDEYQTPFE